MTTNNQYSLYINAVEQLAQTIVIKSTDTVEGLNQYVSDYFGAAAFDETDPTTWKYYLNISGVYHPTDTPMTVTSMDTLETINFTKENLLIHRATAKGYQYGTRQYLEFVAQYPNQEMLILGILYPADITTAIAAKEGTILSYPQALVEVNEYSFIAKLQRWIYGYKSRWVNQQYGISDPLYPAVHLGIMYLNLIPAILNIRLAACKTNEAHSFHVRTYLASHNSLDAYMDQLTTNQALYFYRNINYLQRNSGKRANFATLTEHIMTERSLPIAEYSMRHDISQQPTNTDPTLTFRRTPLNTATNVDAADTVDLTTLMTKEQPLAPANAAVQADQIDNIATLMVNAKSNVLLTKVLESAMIDYTDSTPYTLTDILLNHWVWLASNGNYTAFVTTTNPKTGENIPLSVKDAFCLMFYCWMQSVGIVLDVIPPMIAKRVQRIGLPTVEELMSVVDATLIPQELATLILQDQPLIGPILSTSAFYTLCQQIAINANLQRNVTAFQEHKDARGYMHGMISRIYSDNECLVADSGDNYTNWLNTRNIHTGDFTIDDYGLMYTDLLKQATGLSLVSTTSVRALQASMVQMLAQLSSYSVQFVTQINASNIQLVDWPAIRVGDTHSSGSGEFLVDVIDTDIQRYHAKGKDSDSYDINAPALDQHWYAHGHSSGTIDIDVKPTVDPLGFRWTVVINVARVTPHSHTPLSQNSQGVVPVLGVDGWLQLPGDERGFKDVYGNLYDSNEEDGALSDALDVKLLDGLIYTQPSGTTVPVTTFLSKVVVTTNLPGLTSTAPPAAS